MRLSVEERPDGVLLKLVEKNKGRPDRSRR